MDALTGCFTCGICTADLEDADGKTVMPFLTCFSCNFQTCFNCISDGIAHNFVRSNGDVPCFKCKFITPPQIILHVLGSGSLGQKYVTNMTDPFVQKKYRRLVEEKDPDASGSHSRDEVASRECIQSTSKPCPGCNAPIEKVEGCNDMFCTLCRTPFHWRTMEMYVESVHNPHLELSSVALKFTFFNISSSYVNAYEHESDADAREALDELMYQLDELDGTILRSVRTITSGQYLTLYHADDPMLLGSDAYERIRSEFLTATLSPDEMRRRLVDDEKRKLGYVLFNQLVRVFEDQYRSMQVRARDVDFMKSTRRTTIDFIAYRAKRLNVIRAFNLVIGTLTQLFGIHTQYIYAI